LIPVISKPLLLKIPESGSTGNDLHYWFL